MNCVARQPSSHPLAKATPRYQLCRPPPGSLDTVHGPSPGRKLFKSRLRSRSCCFARANRVQHCGCARDATRAVALLPGLPVYSSAHELAYYSDIGALSGPHADNGARPRPPPYLL